MPRKVAVIGVTGSGKTSLARRLADALDVPHIELDALFWRPGWQMAPTDEFRAQVEEALLGEAWVIDGNYRGRIGSLVLERADVVVWLDPPLRTIVARLVRRTVRRIRGREELWSTNRETWRNAFLSRDSLLVYGVKTHRRWRRTLPAVLAQYETVRLRSRRDADAWLERVTRHLAP